MSQYEFIQSGCSNGAAMLVGGNWSRMTEAGSVRISSDEAKLTEPCNLEHNECLKVTRGRALKNPYKEAE